MDIKDWILVGGGLLLVAVIGHGFWLAWRSRTRYAADGHRSEHSARRRRSARPAARGAAERRRPRPQGRTERGAVRAGSGQLRPTKRRKNRRTIASPSCRTAKSAPPQRQRRPARSCPNGPRERSRSAARGAATAGASRPQRHEPVEVDVETQSEPAESHDPDRSHRHQRAGAQRREVRRHRADGGVSAQRPQVRRHEHLPPHPAGVEGSAVQRRERGGTRHVRPVCDGRRSARPA